MTRMTYTKAIRMTHSNVLPAERRVAGDCGICGKAILIAPGQHITQGKYGISHKACRGRGKNKTKGYG